MTTLRLLLLILVAMLSLGAVDNFNIPSECAVKMYLPPIPGTPQTTSQQIALMPASTTTFRACYATSKGKLCGGATYADADDDDGKSVTGNARGEFAITGLTANTKYHWKVECLEHGQWRYGWEGQFITMPDADDDVVMLIGTDSHYLVNFFNSAGEDPADENYDLVQRSRGGFHLLAREHGAHLYLDLGDTFFYHCGTCDGSNTYTDEFGRRVGVKSITQMARTQAEEVGFGNVRASMTLRRMWRFLRNNPSMWARGNHDVGGLFGESGGDHWQWRAQPWVTTGLSLQTGVGGDFNVDGTVTAPGHGLGHGDGPFRMVSDNWDVAATPPALQVCGAGPVDPNIAVGEGYIKTTGVADNTNHFEFALSDDAASTTCTFNNQGSGGAVTLVKGSDMQHTTKLVSAKYLPNQNDVHAHGYGTPEDGIMGPMPLADYGMLIMLDQYDHSPSTGCPPAAGSECFPTRETWTLGAQQLAGVNTLIDAMGVGGYADVNILMLATHSGLGGYDFVGGYDYGRGSLCETATRCVGNPGTYCTVDTQCPGADTCDTQDCTDDFDNAEWEGIQDKLEDFVTRTDGIAIVLMGHDHLLAFGEKAATGVYYLTAGQLGSKIYPGWLGDPETVKRYDFDDDGIPAYRRHYCALGEGACPAGTQNDLVEVGSEHRGYAKLTLCEACGTANKPKVLLDYIISNRADFESLSGQSAPGFPLTIEGQ